MLHKSEEEKILALKKHLSEGGIKGDYLLKKSGWSDLYIHFYRWFSVWCYEENVNFGLV